MLPNQPAIDRELIRRDLNRPDDASANVFHELPSGFSVPFPDAMRHHKFRVGVNAAPKPKLSALGIFAASDHPARMTADNLILFVHFESQAR